MSWEVAFIPQAREDLSSLDKAQQMQVIKAIQKVAQNPLPDREGGYGKPLGNRQPGNLAGCCKIKLLRIGIRVVYKLVREDSVMKIVVIAARSDDAVYAEAQRRIKTAAAKE